MSKGPESELATLRKRVSLLQTTLSSVEDLVFMLDENGVFLEFEPTACQNGLYAPPEEFVGKRYDNVLPDHVSALLAISIDKVKRTGIVDQFDYPINLGGDRLWYTAKVTTRRDSQGNYAGVIIVARDVTLRKQSEMMLRKTRDELEILVRERTREISEINEKLRFLSNELILAEERQRRHIANDLHDSVGQALAIAKIRLGGLKKSAASPDISDEIGDIIGIVDQIIRETRSLTFEISPPILYRFGLVAAIEWLSEKIREDHGIRVEFESDEGFRGPCGSTGILLFRAARELMLNIIKHAKAGCIRITVRKKGECARIRIRDDGMGFDAEKIESDFKTNPGFGLFSIRERMTHLGGQFDIVSKPGHGTEFTLTAPLEKESDDG